MLKIEILGNRDIMTIKIIGIRKTMDLFSFTFVVKELAKLQVTLHSQ